jgi:hypothetical protein
VEEIAWGERVRGVFGTGLMEKRDLEKCPFSGGDGIMFFIVGPLRAAAHFLFSYTP